MSSAHRGQSPEVALSFTALFVTMTLLAVYNATFAYDAQIFMFSPEWLINRPFTLITSMFVQQNIYALLVDAVLSAAILVVMEDVMNRAKLTLLTLLGHLASCALVTACFYPGHGIVLGGLLSATIAPAVYFAITQIKSVGKRALLPLLVSLTFTIVFSGSLLIPMLVCSGAAIIVGLIAAVIYRVQKGAWSLVEEK